MTKNAIDQFETAKRSGRHYILFQTDAKRLTKTPRRKNWRKFSPPSLFFPVGEVGLKHRVSELELEDNARLLWWMSGRKAFQMFHTFDDYQARSWSRARKIVTKVEITQMGSMNVRFVVTNMSGLASGIYQGFYVQRGNVPERPIGELKNGLQSIVDFFRSPAAQIAVMQRTLRNRFGRCRV